MTHKGRPPATRRTFVNRGQELEYLYSKLLYWLYSRNRPSRARHFGERMRVLLPEIKNISNTILGNDCLALIAESEGDWPEVVRYKRREVRLIEKARGLARNGDPIASGELLSPTYLSLNYDYLAVALRNSGRYREALAVLAQSERLCKQHQIKFSGDDLKAEVEKKLASKQRTR